MIQGIFEVLLIPYVFLLALVSRFKAKKIDIGIGPQPLINNVYHKKALELYGYSVETFATNPFYITQDFDIVLSEKYNVQSLGGRLCAFMQLIHLAFKYNILYFYFNGGPLGVSTKLLWKLEPLMYRLAKVSTVVMPYGSDVQEMTRSKNLYFKHVLHQDYPLHKRRRKLIAQKIDLWSQHASFVLSGCEWVDYMYSWDKLMLAHFSIELEEPEKREPEYGMLKICHAPNHKAIKGSEYLITAVEELQAEGYDIELNLLSGVSNREVLKAINDADLIADQFVIGWYAMFALEAMAKAKPVMCYLREDLIDLYVKAGLIDGNEIPLINTDILNIKKQLIWAYNHRDKLVELGEASRQYVQKHHSLESVGKTFDIINQSILGGKR